MSDRDGMFTDARLLAGRNHVEGNLSVVTCTLCGSLIADTEAHRQSHSVWTLPGDDPRDEP
jgi:hypothetical protein